MGRYASVVGWVGPRRKMPWPRVAHCRDCGTRVWWYPENFGLALCESCRPPYVSDVHPPVDVPLPAWQSEDERKRSPNPTSGRWHRFEPCPKCGGETWNEGNRRKSCINGHVIRGKR